MTWNPILDGAAARRAEEALERVVTGLVLLDEEEVRRSREQPLYHRGLAGGVAGQSLFWAYLAECRSDDGAAERAMHCLERAGDELAETAMDASLYGGIAGVGWVSEHLTGRLFEADDDEDPIEEIDQVLLELLGQPRWPGKYDLVSGLAGLGVYALERMPRPSARQIAEGIVAHLDRLAVERDGGMTWYTPPEFLPPHQLEVCPRGYYNLGVAHGMPAVISFLAGACRHEIAAATARPLLDGAVSWLLSMRLDEGAGSLFPNFVYDERPPEPSRMAWCYGDPGIAAVLLAAARSVGQEEWEEEALEVARAAARRTPDTAGVQDHGLCHGSAGLGHLFNRIYQASGDEVCANAAHFWFDRALNHPLPGEWRTDFPTVRPHPDGHMEMAEETAMLTGVSGVGLALLAATTELSPDWDRALLVAVPSAANARPEATDAELLATAARG